MFPFALTKIFSIPLFFLIQGAAFLLYSILAGRRLCKNGISLYRCLLLFTWIIFWGIVGGKFYDLIDNWNYYQYNINNLLLPSGYGCNGVLLFGIIALIFIFKIWKIPELPHLDIFLYYLPLVIAIGRFSCLITADGDYGIPTALPWGMRFPYGYYPVNIPVHPTPLYEILILFLLFIILKIFIFNKTDPGWTTVISAWGYSTQRFLIEFIRLNRKIALGLTLAQWICIIFFIMAAGVAIYLIGKNKRIDAVIPRQ